MHKILYLGIDPSRYKHAGLLVHCPIIKTVPIFPLDDLVVRIWPSITHVLFTSPSAVKHWPLSLIEKKILSIGGGTSSEIPMTSLIAPFSTQEGVIELIESLDLSGAYLFWPHSSKSRPLIQAYLTRKKVRFYAFDLYETQTHRPSSLPDLAEFAEIVFTSPSTVHAFIELFGAIPSEKKITSIGPVTASLVAEKLDRF